MMMEEVSGEENAAAAAPSQVMDQLQEAAQTSVTQASPEQRQATPPRSSSAPNPAAAMTPPTQLPPHLTTPGGPAGSLPPTAGFVPATGVVRASPPKQYFTPGQTQPVVPPTSPPNMPSLTAVPPAPTSYTNPLPSPGTPAQPAVQAGVVPSTEAISAIDLSGSSEGPPLHTMGQDNEGAGLFGWLSGGIVNKVMEKTKSSVESMITTLDPGMKEVICTGGEVDLIVTSEKEVKVGAVRQAFQEVFGKATVSGKDSQPSIAPQPVGYTSALKGAEDRIDNLRRKSAIHERQAAVSVENFIAEILPDRWFDLGCIMLRDPDNNIELTTFTTAVPVPANYVMAAQDATPSDYPLRWSGLAVTVGQMISQQNPHIEHSDWHHALTGVSRRELIYLAAKTLAGMYKQRLPQQAH